MRRLPRKDGIGAMLPEHRAEAKLFFLLFLNGIAEGTYFLSEGEV